MSLEPFLADAYKAFLKEIKDRIQTAQIKAAVTVNREMLLLYWDLGQSIIQKQKITSWGDGFIKQMSKDLQVAFPEMKGFSERNLKYMRQWVQFWLEHSAFDSAAEDTIGQQVVAQFTQIPWGQNLLVISKAKDHEEALFYVQKTMQNNWSRAVLLHQIESQLYERSGKAIDNFSATLADYNA